MLVIVPLLALTVCPFVQHYPKLKKYISLFPPELRAEPHAHPDPYPHTYTSSKDASGDAKPENDTDAQREEVRAWVREQMASGQMSAEPEVELRTREHKRPHFSPSHEQPGAKVRPVKTSVPAMSQEIEGDEFFGDDDGGEDGESNVGAEGEDEEMDSD